jgi:hypothetical protein
MLAMRIEPPLFDPMFRPGTRYWLGDGTQAAVEVQDAGTLHLATGRLSPAIRSGAQRYNARYLPLQ